MSYFVSSQSILLLKPARATFCCVQLVTLTDRQPHCSSSSCLGVTVELEAQSIQRREYFHLVRAGLMFGSDLKLLRGGITVELGENQPPGLVGVRRGVLWPLNGHQFTVLIFSCCFLSVLFPPLQP